MNPSELLEILNHASREGLLTLPGIGPALADRLVAARPFDSLESAQAVEGISVKFLDRLKDSPASQPGAQAYAATPGPQAAGEPPTDSRLSDIKEGLEERGQAIREGLSGFGDSVRDRSLAAREAVSEGLSGLGESVSKRGQAARQAVEALPAKFEQAAQTRGPLWTTLVSSAVSALAAILLTLAILGGINGSLKFATGSQYRTMQREAAQLATQAATLQQDFDGLRGRVDTLEGLGERTVTLEKAQAQLAIDLRTARQQVAALQTEVNGLTEQIAQQEERTLRFEDFLKNLQSLLGDLFAPQGEPQ